MTTERPILFNDEMVRAILAGRKTQTRRPVKGSPAGPLHMTGRDDLYDRWFGAMGPGGVIYPCPFGVHGDVLWVRECWTSADRMYQGHENDEPSVVAYRADRTAIQFDAEPHRVIPSWDLATWNWDALRWRPSIHMPRWASRLSLRVTEVRVERVQDISEGDAEREGVTASGCVGSFRDAFVHAWPYDGTEREWMANPWVWAVSFEVMT